MGTQLNLGPIGTSVNRRNFVRAAAGLSLTIPALGVTAKNANANDTLFVSAQHDHGAAAIGEPPEEFKLYDPVLAPVEPGHKEITVVAVDATLPISKDINFAGWTYDGTIPGKMLRVVEGDTVDFTFKVDSNALIGHSLDFHSVSSIAPNEAHRTIGQGEELSYTFTAKYPGAYMYHCGTPPILMHLGAGMFGAMIVDPKDGWSPAQEFAFVQSEYYLTDDGSGTGTMTSNYAAMLGNGTSNLTVFNGYANQYAENPIPCKAGEPMRVFVVNCGPNAWSSFHVVGTIFDRAYVNGNPKNELVGLQSITIGPGDGAVVEFVLPEPGTYPFVNHAFGHASQGALGLFAAE